MSRLSMLCDAPMYLIVGILAGGLQTMDAMFWIFVFGLSAMISRIGHEHDVKQAIERQLKESG